MRQSMTLPELEPNIDAYGRHARTSALADFLELLALHGRSKTRATLSDDIDDQHWGRKLEEQYGDGSRGVAGDAGEGIADSPEEAAERVIALLEQRRSVLQERYPFVIDEENGRLRLSGSDRCPYMGLLSITLAQAFRLSGAPDPTVVFEDTVARALSSAGHPSVNFSGLRRQHATFQDALKAAGAILDVQVSPLAARTRKFTQDGGVDVIAHVTDGYAMGESWSTWTLLGQVTCGQSDSWAKKLGDVKVQAWGKRLVSEVRAFPFLAVPHHAEPQHLFELVEAEGRMVFDRLRLVRMLGDVSDEEEEILAAVKGVPIAP